MPQKRQSTRNPQTPQSISADILPDELWQHIGHKLSIADRIRFRAVCKSWLSLLPLRVPPWLMLAESQQPNQPATQPDPKPDPPPRGFVCLGEQSIHECHFPSLHGSLCVGASKNWLITVHLDTVIRLTDPFDRRQIHFSSVLLIDDILIPGGTGDFSFSDIHLWKIALNSSPSDWGDDDVVAMAIYHVPKRLAFGKPYDLQWTTLEISFPMAVVHDQFGVHDQFEDVVFYKERFYAITNCGSLVVCDLDPPKATFLTGEPSEELEEFDIQRVNYLVEWLGELLMVCKYVEVFEDEDYKTYKTSKFEIYKFDFGDKKWTGLKSLGEHSLFLGLNTSVSVLASDYFGLVKKNCVYFTDDYVLGCLVVGETTTVGHDMGVFDLEDKCIKPHFGGISVSLTSPPVWIFAPERDSSFLDDHPRWSALLDN